MTKEYIAQLEQLIISGNAELAIQLAKSINIDIADVYSAILKKIGLPLPFRGCATAEEIVNFFLQESFFYCSSSKLAKLDVSCNTALDSLDCHNNQLTKLDVSCNTALDSLCCDDNQLTALDVSRNTALKVLTCHNNQLETLDVSFNKDLQYFRCSNNQLTTLDLSCNTALVYLDAIGNNFSKSEQARIQETWPSCKMLF